MTAAADAGRGPLAGGLGTLLRRADARLFAAGSVHRFATIRTLLAVVVGARILLGPYSRLADAPPEVWDPPIVTSWLSDPPSVAIIRIIQALGLIGAVAVMARRFERAGFATAWLSLLLLAGMRDSVGKVMHNEVLLLVGCMPILFGPPAARMWDRTRSAAAGWPVRAAAIAIAFVYFWAGYQKLRYTGIGWVTGENMQWTAYQAATSQLPRTDALALFIGDHRLLSSLLAGGALGFELTAPVLICHRWGRMLFVLGSLFLHTSIYLTHGLDYWGWILTSWILLTPWDGLRRSGGLRRDPERAG